MNQYRQPSKRLLSPGSALLLKAALLSNLALLGACTTSTAPLNYYLLERGGSTRENEDNQPDFQHRIALQELRFAPYLTQPNLTLLRGEHGVYYPSSHIWAEPLRDGVIRALTVDLSRHSVRLLEENSDVTTHYTLRLSIENLSATDDSKALLTGEFWLHKSGEPLVNQRFHFQEKLSSDGYTHAIEQQRKLLRELTALIFASLSRSFDK